MINKCVFSEMEDTKEMLVFKSGQNTSNLNVSFSQPVFALHTVLAHQIVA